MNVLVGLLMNIHFCEMRPLPTTEENLHMQYTKGNTLFKKNDLITKKRMILLSPPVRWQTKRKG